MKFLVQPWKKLNNSTIKYVGNCRGDCSSQCYAKCTNLGCPVKGLF